MEILTGSNPAPGTQTHRDKPREHPVKVWILTKGTDIDTPSILGVFDRELGYEHFATEATAMHQAANWHLLDDEADEPPLNPLDAATRAQDDSLYLDIRGDVLTLTPHDYVTKGA